jgi:hypothetical protein
MITPAVDDDEHQDHRDPTHEVGIGTDMPPTQPANGNCPDAGTAPL